MLGFIVALSLTATVARPSVAQDSTTATLILGLERAWWDAQQHDDTVAFLRLLAPDLTFIGTSGSLRDRASFIASRRGSWIPRAATFTLSELRVRVYGTVAVVTGRGTSTGAGVAGSARFTDVWRLRAGTWQLVAIQRTDVAAPT
jgi:ketosteroid isomerase-like protein